MKIKVISFTKNGIDASVELKNALKGKTYKRFHNSYPVKIKCDLFTSCKSVSELPREVSFWPDSLASFVEEGFRNYDALIFIGACGIAVRAIAPYIKDKLTDKPVLVMDEKKQNIIPILAGHVGGANRLTQYISDLTGIRPVITTATDLNHKLAVDLFATENGLLIEKREGIATVSAKALNNETITISIEGNEYDGTLPSCFKLVPYEDKGPTDVLITEDKKRKNGTVVFRQGEIVVGIGCKRGTPAKKIGDFVWNTIKENNIPYYRISAISSIDLKKDEEGLLEFADRTGTPFFTFSAEQLEAVEGDFKSSDFVKDVTGVDNVCERAAMAAAGEGGKLILGKTCGDGITIAVARRKNRIVFATSDTQYRDYYTDTVKEDKNIIYVVGMGPGEEKSMTSKALSVLEKCDAIIGYTVYLDLLPERFKRKELLSTPMRREKERCVLAFEKASEGKAVAMICSGDAGIYGMASLIYEIGEKYPETEVEVIPGITAASSGAAVLGAPLNHDFCVISLSDLLTPWEKIEARLKAAAAGDFAIAIYNPSSKKRKDYLKKACEILLCYIEPERPCGYVRNIGRENEELTYCNLEELKDKEVDMFTTVFIGNSETEMICGKLVTKRGYNTETENPN